MDDLFGLWLVEIKQSSVPKVSRGFHSGCEDRRPDRRFVVLGGVGEPDDYPFGGGIRVMTLPAMVSWIESR